MAVGALAMQVPETVQASTGESDPDWIKGAGELSCGVYSGNHIKSYEVNDINGSVTVKMKTNFDKESLKAQCYGGTIWAFEQELEPVKTVDNEEYYTYEPKKSSGKSVGGPIENGDSTIALTGLTVGTTYHLYALVVDPHTSEGELTSDYGVHYMMYLGSATPTASSGSGSSSGGSSSSSSSASSGSNTSGSSNSKSAWASYEDKVSNKIEAAPSGSTIVMEKGVSALSNSMMKELLKKGDVSLKLEFTYNDVEYVIIIPAGAALDNDIPWYGPLYLAQQFGNSAGNAAAVTAKASGAYEVKSGDSMNKIATANNMTLTQLLTKNPQIKDPNKIAVGQKINL